MRKLTLCLATCLLAGATFAQKGLEIGLNFTPTNTWIMNSEDFAEDQTLDFRGTFGYNAGLTLGYNFSDGLGITSGIIFSKQGQNYITGYDNIAKADQAISSRQLSYVRIPVLFKINGKLDGSGTSFFRIGPYFDLLSGAKYTYDTRKAYYPLPTTSGNYSLNPYKNLFGTEYKIYQKMVIGLMLEAGGMVNVSESMKLVFALQLCGSLTNTETADSYRAGFPSDASNKRSTAYNVSGGITVGFNYVLSFD